MVALAGTLAHEVKHDDVTRCTEILGKFLVIFVLYNLLSNIAASQCYFRFSILAHVWTKHI